MTGKPSLALQYLEHAAGHGDTALVHDHLGCDEDQAAGRAHHVRLRYQDLADLAGLDEMRIELHGREHRLSRHVSRRHAAGAIRERHQHPALHQAAAVMVLVLRYNRWILLAPDHPFPPRPAPPE